MTIFTWSNDAAIQKMQIRPFGKKGAEAVLYASGGGRGELAQLADHMRSLGWNAIPDVEKGQHILHLRGFQQPDEVIKELEKNRSVAGEYKTEKSPPQPKPKLKFMEKIRKVSLVAAGYAFGAGDAALMTVGKLRNNASGNSEFMSGLAFSTSSVLLMRYGNKKPEKSFKELHDRMLGQFVMEGVDIPGAEYLDLKSLGKPGGLASRIDHFLYEHPAEVNCTINAYAGYRMADAGMKMRESDKKAGTFKATAGSLLMAGNTVSLLTPEKAKKTDKERPGQEKEKKEAEGNALLRPLRAVTDWVQEKPMRVTGTLAVINNFFQLASALTERKHTRNATGRERHFWALNLAASLSYMTGNALLAISPKDTNANMKDGVHDPFADIYASAAAILINQPEEVRRGMVNRMAANLASQPEISISPHEVGELIQQKITELKDSPWIDAGRRVQEEDSAHEMPEKEQKRWVEREERPSAARAAWADKEFVRETRGSEEKDANLAGHGRY